MLVPILAPDFFPFRIPDPTTTKILEEETIRCLTFYCSYKLHNLKIIVFE